MDFVWIDDFLWQFMIWGVEEVAEASFLLPEYIDIVRVVDGSVYDADIVGDEFLLEEHRFQCAQCHASLSFLQDFNDALGLQKQCQRVFVGELMVLIERSELRCLHRVLVAYNVKVKGQLLLLQCACQFRERGGSLLVLPDEDGIEPNVFLMCQEFLGRIAIDLVELVEMVASGISCIKGVYCHVGTVEVGSVFPLAVGVSADGGDGIP